RFCTRIEAVPGLNLCGITLTRVHVEVSAWGAWRSGTPHSTSRSVSSLQSPVPTGMKGDERSLTTGPGPGPLERLRGRNRPVRCEIKWVSVSAALRRGELLGDALQEGLSSPTREIKLDTDHEPPPSKSHRLH